MRCLSTARWTADVHAKLDALVRDPGQARPLAVFDWDNTCITGDIGEAVLARLDRDAAPGCVDEYARLCSERGDAIGYRYCAEVTGGLSKTATWHFVGGVIDDALADGTIAVRPEIRELMWAMQSNGWEVWVVSASAEPLVEVFAQRYGIAADRVIGMELGLDAAGQYTREVVGPVTYRGGKVDAIDQRIGRRPTFAAGDAMTDLEMLASAEHALLFDRGNRELGEIAGRSGWWIQPAF